MNIKSVGIEPKTDARNLLTFGRHLAPMPVILPDGCRKLLIFINPFRYARLQRLVHLLTPGAYPTVECRNRFRILLPLELLRNAGITLYRDVQRKPISQPVLLAPPAAAVIILR